MSFLHHKYFRQVAALFTFILVLLLWTQKSPAADAVLADEQLRSLVTVSGNHFLSAAELMKKAEEELHALEAADLDLSLVDDAAFQMELAYRNAGFPQAFVSYQIDSHIPMVKFSVNEGKRLLLSAVTFEGNSRFPSKTLLALDSALNAMATKNGTFPYVEQRLKALQKNIQDHYRSEGYLDVSVDKPELLTDPNPEGPARVRIQIKEGRIYTVGKIEFSGSPLPETGNELTALAASLRGIPFHPRTRLVLRSSIQTLYANKGYPDITLEINTTKHTDQGIIDLVADITPGPKAVIQTTTINGLERTRESFIYKRLEFEEGDIYSLKAEKESFAALYQSGLFSRVNIRLNPLDDQGEKELVIDVQEKPARSFFIEPGWGSYELLRLTAGYADKNLFGSGKNIRLEGNGSAKSRQLSAGYNDPRFLDTPVMLDFPLTYRYRKEPEFTLEETGASLFFSKKLARQARFGLGYTFQSKTLTDISTTLDPVYSDNNYNNASITMNVSRDTRDDFFLPEQGYRGYAAIEYADEVIGGDLAYLRFTTGVRRFQKLGERHILALRYATGVIIPLQGQENIPLGERFFNGGENSVRSFREARLGPKDETGASLGGTAYNTFNVELRRRLGEHLAGSIFLDAGNVAPNKTDSTGLSPLAAGRKNLIEATWKDYFRDFRYGVGFGLQYLLPIGPARLDFGFNPDRRESTENSYAVHLSVGMAF